MNGLWRDIRFGIRMLAKHPAFSAVAVLTLALGIGANTAIFSVIDAALLRPLPYSNANRIVVLYRRPTKKSKATAHPLPRAFSRISATAGQFVHLPGRVSRHARQSLGCGATRARRSRGRNVQLLFRAGCRSAARQDDSSLARPAGWDQRHGSGLRAVATEIRGRPRNYRPGH